MNLVVDQVHTQAGSRAFFACECHRQTLRAVVGVLTDVVWDRVTQAVWREVITELA